MNIKKVIKKKKRQVFHYVFHGDSSHAFLVVREKTIRKSELGWLRICS